MNTLTRLVAIAIVLLFIALPVFAQDETEVPKPTAEVTAEVTAEPLPVVEPEAPLAEPVTPNETIDVQTWVDDVLEYLSSHTGEIILGVGLLLAILRIKQPMTATEKAQETAEIARQKEEARLTPEITDDFIVVLKELVLSMRRMEEALPIATAPTVTVASGTPQGSQQTVNVFTEDAPPVINSPVELPPIEG